MNLTLPKIFVVSVQIGYLFKNGMNNLKLLTNEVSR